MNSLDLDRAERLFCRGERLHGRRRGGVLDPRSAHARHAAALRAAARRAAASDRAAARAHHRRADLLGDRDHLGRGRATCTTRSRASASAAGACSRSPPRRASRSARPGTHPWADYREQPIIDTEHYRRVEEGLQYVAWRNNTFSLHVHLGVRDLDRAVRVCDRLRPVLPLLLAISANSPYLDGRDSGLHSARTQSFTKSFPRCGIPDAFGGWAAYREYIEFLDAHALDRRVHPGLVVGAARTSASAPSRCASATRRRPPGVRRARVADRRVHRAGARDVDEGVPFDGSGAADDRGEHVARDPLRARRAADRPGRAARSIRRARRSSAWRAWTAPIRAELGIELAFPERNGAQRQRRMIEAGASREEVFAASVARDRSRPIQQEVAV